MEIAEASPAGAYLAAAIDGEGHIPSKNRPGRHRPQHYVVIVNTEIEFIRACRDACEALGIQYRIRGRDEQKRAKALYELYISTRSELEKVWNLVPLQHPEKVQALRANIDSYGQDEDVLLERIREMVEGGSSTREIAAATGIGPDAVRLRYRKLGLPRRSTAPGRPPVQYEDVDEWASMYAEGFSLTEVANAFGQSYATIRTRLHKRGIVRPQGSQVDGSRVSASRVIDLP